MTGDRDNIATILARLLISNTILEAHEGSKRYVELRAKQTRK
jgi:hypothetical protein